MNNIKNEERERIYKRARELLDQDVIDGELRLMDEFQISSQRAQTAWAKAVARKRGEQYRRAGRPATYDDAMDVYAIRLSRIQIDWLEKHDGGYVIRQWIDKQIEQGI